MSRRQGSITKRIMLALSAIVAVPLLVGLLLMILINPDDYKPEVVTALQQATGRKVSIGGRLSVAFGFAPTVTLKDIHISNPPGFSRDDMAVIGALEAKVSVIPLLFHKVHVGLINISDADVLIETNALGQTNTKFTPAPAKPSDAAASAPPAAAAPSADADASNPLDKIRIDQIGIFAGHFASRDDIKGAHHDLLINRAVLRTLGRDQSLSIVADIAYDRFPLAFNLDTGALGRLFGQNVGPVDWPVRLHAESRASQLSLQGTVQSPLSGKGYHISVEAALDDLSHFSGVLGQALPPVHDVRLSFGLNDNEGLPSFSDLLVRSGNSDLTNFAEGLSLDHLVLSAPSMDMPMHGELAGQFSNQPLSASLDVGAPHALITALLRGVAKNAKDGQALPLAIDAQIAGAHFTAQGSMAQPTALTGFDAAVTMKIPDLTAFSALAGQRLPALSNLDFSVHLADMPGGLTQGVKLHDIAFQGSLGDLAGDLDIGLQPRLKLAGQLGSSRLDLDALLIASEKANASSVAARAAQPTRRLATRFVMSDSIIDFSGFNRFDLDMALKMREIRSGGVTYRDVAGHAVLANGKLVVDPFAATLPGGALELRLSVDAQALPPSMSVALAAPGIALKPLLTAFHQPDDVTGTIEIGADLSAAGRTAHAIAASLSGKLGVAMVDGELDNRILGAPLNEVLRVAHLPSDVLVGGSGSNRTKLRCVALRADSVRGLTNISNMVLQTSAAQLQGGGVINFSDETVTLRLRPALRTVGTNVVIPVKVSGTLAAPVASLDTGSAVDGLTSSVTSTVSGGLSGLARGLTGAAGNDNDPCPSGVAAARAVQPFK